MSAAIDQLPDAAHELGELRAEFRVSRGDAIIMAMFASVGAIVIAPYAFLRIAPAFLPAGKWPLIVCGAVAGGVILATLIGFWNQMRKVLRGQHARVLVFDDGVVCFRSHQVLVCRFDEVRQIREIYCDFLNELIFVTESGQEHTVASASDLLEDFIELVRLLEWEATERMLPAALADFHTGQPLGFGALELTPEGVCCKGRILPWAEVSDLETDDYWIKVKRRGARSPWATVSADEVVNRLLLGEIAGQVLARTNG